ncbi:MAG: hypothetical protein U0401_00205 [Anaerolineae bacterium]
MKLSWGNLSHVGEPGFFERVIYRVVSDAAAQKLAWKLADIDIALDISADQISAQRKFQPDRLRRAGRWNLPDYYEYDPPSAACGARCCSDAIRLAIDYED